MLQANELISEVQAILGRPNDTEIATSARITRWLNEAQHEIVEMTPGLHALELDATIAAVSDDIAYGLSEWTSSLIDNTSTVGDTTSNHYIAHIRSLQVKDGVDSYEMQYVPIDDWERRFPDPTNSEHGTGKPRSWTRKGEEIWLFPGGSTDFIGTALNLKGTIYAQDFTTDSETKSSLHAADRGLVYYAVARSWSAIGKHDLEAVWDAKYQRWLAEYSDKLNDLHEWHANIYGPEMRGIIT